MNDMKEKGKLIESPQHTGESERANFEKWFIGTHRFRAEGPAAWAAWKARAELREAESPRQPSTDSTYEICARIAEDYYKTQDVPGSVKAIIGREIALAIRAAELREVSQHPVPASKDHTENCLRNRSFRKPGDFWGGHCSCLNGEHPVPAPQTSHRTWTEVKAEMDSKGEHPVPAPKTQGDNAELVRMAEKLLEWMPIYSKGSSGNIRQTNLRAAIEKFKSEHPEPVKGGGE